MEVVDMRAIFKFLQFRWIWQQSFFLSERDGRRKRILKIVKRIPMENKIIELCIKMCF